MPLNAGDNWGTTYGSLETNNRWRQYVKVKYLRQTSNVHCKNKYEGYKTNIARNRGVARKFYFGGGGGGNCSIDILTIVHIEYKIINFDILLYS